MTSSLIPRYPKLRSVDPRPVTHEDQMFLVLRDPLQLSDKILLVPEPLISALALCDGTRADAHELSLALALRCGVLIPPDILEQLITALDEALLLENDRSARAQEQALAEYRAGDCRRPALAGQAYPADADGLRQLLAGYLDAAGGVDGAAEAAEVRGLVSPHIDYARGGPVYAQVWRRAAALVKEADLAVIFGTDHYGAGTPLTLTRQNYATPFGVLPTPRGIVDALAEVIGPEAAFAGELHHRGEHSIELAAVWLHYARGGQPIEVLPILCGSFGRFTCGEADPEHDPAVSGLLDALNQATAGRRVVVVAAGDLSHVGPAFGGTPVDQAGSDRLKEYDDELIDRMCAGDPAGFLAAISRVEDRNNVCGLPPIYLALKLLGAVSGEQIAYDRCPADDAGTSLVSVCGVVFR